MRRLVVAYSLAAIVVGAATLGGAARAVTYAADAAPTVTFVFPANGQTNVSPSTNLIVTFSENVNVAGGWFQIYCSSSGTHAATVSFGPVSFNLNPVTDFAAGESCTVSVLASRVSDQDANDPPDTMAADFAFRFSTAPAAPQTDVAPVVTTVFPANGQTDVARDANLVLTFSEPVNVTGSWFAIDCSSSGAHTAAVSFGPVSFNLDPDADFTGKERCNVTIVAGLVADQDTSDPPDTLTSAYSFSFTTAPAPQATLTVTKLVTNDDGGTATVGDFRLLVGTTEVSSGVENAFDPGSYTIREEGPGGYEASFSGDCQPDGSITLAAGEVKNCTITNDDIQPRLVVVKHVIDNSGRSAAAGDFTIIVTGSGPSPGTFPGADDPGTTVALDAGSYSVAESGPAGYFSDFSSDCSGSIAIGETRTCVITNDDAAAVTTDVGTPCRDLDAGVAQELNELGYREKRGLIGHAAPVDFVYWTRVLAPSPSFTVEVAQRTTHPTFSTLFDERRVRLFPAGCSPARRTAYTIADGGGETRLEITGATPGEYYVVSVKYSTQSLLGMPTPSPTTVHYDFETRVDGTLVDRDLTGLDLRKR